MSYVRIHTTSIDSTKGLDLFALPATEAIAALGTRYLEDIRLAMVSEMRELTTDCNILLTLHSKAYYIRIFTLITTSPL